MAPRESLIKKSVTQSSVGLSRDDDARSRESCFKLSDSKEREREQRAEAGFVVVVLLTILTAHIDEPARSYLLNNNNVDQSNELLTFTVTFAY